MSTSRRHAHLGDAAAGNTGGFGKVEQSIKLCFPGVERANE